MVKMIDAVAPTCQFNKASTLVFNSQPRYCQRSFRSCRLKHSSCYQLVEAFVRCSDERLRGDKSNLLRVALAPHNLRGEDMTFKYIQYISMIGHNNLLPSTGAPSHIQQSPHPGLRILASGGRVTSSTSKEPRLGRWRKSAEEILKTCCVLTRDPERSRRRKASTGSLNPHPEQREVQTA